MNDDDDDGEFAWAVGFNFFFGHAQVTFPSGVKVWVVLFIIIMMMMIMIPTNMK